MYESQARMFEVNPMQSPRERLMHALSQGNAEAVRSVLKQSPGKDFMLRPANDYTGATALHLAAEHDNAQVVEVLIDAARRLPLNDDDDDDDFLKVFARHVDRENNTALHVAVTHGMMASAKVLVEADPNHKHNQNSDGETPIYIAAKLGHIHILKMMCAICTTPALDGPDGTNAFHAAITRLPKGNSEGSDAVQVLIDALIRYRGGAPKVTQTPINQAENKCRNTALHLAVLGKHLGVVRQILKADMYVSDDLKNIESKTAPYIAAEQGYKDIVKEFHENTAFSLSVRGPRRRTVVHAAVISRDADCLRYVLENTYKLVTSCDEDGWTPLHYAAHYKFDSVLDMIVKAHASYGFGTGYEGTVPTPLWLATQGGHTSTVIQLMKLLPDQCPEIDRENGRNILHFAAFQSDKKMVQAILNYCPENYIDILVKGKDVNGDTPLHLLISKGCFVPELIEYKGIDKMVKNNQNMTPLDMLYLEDDIIADQLQIKKALDGTQVDQHSYFWRRRSKFKSTTQESLVPSWKQSEKDAKFRRVNKILMKEELERYKERTNTQIIVTALIVTVTFTVGFTMPGGYYQSGDVNQGLVLLSKKRAFTAFVISDALALALSTTSLFLYFISTMYEDPYQVSQLNAISTGLNIVSVVAMMLTFITGTYAVLSHSPVVAITVCIICSTFFLSIIILLVKMRYDRENTEVNAP